MKNFNKIKLKMNFNKIYKVKIKIKILKMILKCTINSNQKM